MSTAQTQRWARRVACVGLVGVLFVLGGCGGSDDVLSEDQQMRREIDLFEQQIMEHENEIALCMAERGFQYVAELPPDWLAERASAEAVLDGHPDPQSVAQATFDAEVATGRANDQYFASLDEADRLAFEQAYNGSDNQVGCYDATYNSVWDADDNAVVLDEDTIDELVGGSAGEAAALADYERCMAEHGFVVSGLYQVFEYQDEQREIIVDGRAEGVTLDEALEEFHALADVIYQANAGCQKIYQDQIFELIDEKLTARYAEE